MIQITQQINDVQRQVGNRTLAAGEAATVTISQVYDADLDDTWDACTNPDRIRRWFLPVSGELREGGSFQLEGNANGTIEACDPPNGFKATWEFGGSVSWIEVTLSREGERATRVQLQHLAVIDEHWEQFGPGAGGVGWDAAFLGLGLHLSTGEGMDPDAAAAWMASEEGREFFRRSSEAWAKAHIASGANPEDAMAAAERTQLAYTGAPTAGDG